MKQEKKKDKGLQLSLVKNLWQFSIIDITKLLNCLQTLHDQHTMTITINTDLFVQHPIQYHLTKCRFKKKRREIT